MALKLVGFLPLAVTVGGLWVWLHFRHLWKGEHPVDCKLLRGPGESLRLKMEEFGEQLLTPVSLLETDSRAPYFVIGGKLRSKVWPIFQN